MRIISAQQITDTVARLCIEANTRLPRDVQEALDKARAEEPWPLAKNTLDLLWSNLAAAKEEDLPICQDTGMACVFVELGTDVHIDGSFEAAIHEGVRRGYTDGYLRKSIVADPLRRGNTGDNTPAAITVHLVDGDGCTITVAPKGFGSENMSRIQMLKPADGVEGFKKFVIETVKLAGSNPCPPIVLGVGVGGSFEAAIHEGVRRGYTDGYLRKSIVADPLRRGNTGDNTPAAITVHLVDGDGCTITVAPKGFGSENMSRIQMLKPADGVEGFKKFVIETVKLAGSNPCPPIVLGVGVGGSFDKVAYLAKKALLRPLDVPNPDPYYADLEKELLTAINELGIGPQGFGGRTTCLGLAIEQMPTHVAGLPVAVNVSCHVTRRASAAL